MNRRDTVLALIAVRALTSGALLALGALSFAAEAQPAAAVPRIGYLAFNGATNPHLREAFLQGLRDLGYVEGRNLAIEYRDAEGKVERLPALAAELVALKVDVIFAGGGTTPALAAKRATKNLPIVFACCRPDYERAGYEPCAAGRQCHGAVRSRCGAGQQTPGTAQAGCSEAQPVGVLWQPGALPERTEKDMVKGVEDAARALEVRLQFLEVRGAADVDRAFSEMTRARAGGLAVLPGGIFITERKRLVDLAAKNRLPAVYGSREFVDAGGLMAYGSNLADLFRRAATYVDKILKGAKPGDLPVEQPTKFELVINLKAAKALGLTIPQSVLLRADEVIQ